MLNAIHWLFVICCFVQVLPSSAQWVPDSPSALGKDQGDYILVYPSFGIGVGIADVRGDQEGHSVFGGGLGIIYQRFVFVAETKGLGMDLSSRYEQLDDDVCLDSKTGRAVAEKFCSEIFIIGAFDLNYALPLSEDRFLVGMGLRTGQLGLRPYASLRWVPVGALFFGWTFQLAGSYDFLEVSIRLSTFLFPIPL